MSIEIILISVLVVGGAGLLIGLLLGLAGKKFAVEIDEREALVREALPGNNCGGCGYRKRGSPGDCLSGGRRCSFKRDRTYYGSGRGRGSKNDGICSLRRRLREDTQ